MDTLVYKFGTLGADFQWVTGKTFFSEFHQPVLAVVFYLVTIYSLQWLMKNRAPFKLKGLAIVHNFILAVGSLVMFLAMAYHLSPNFFNKGAASVLCDADGENFVKGPVNWWFYVFYFSKIYEFLDTIILVLRKKPLIFLHVYHHCITLMLVWSTLQEHNPVAWADITANCFVHIVMYFYYFLCEFGIHPWWKKYITNIQIVQFCWDIFWHQYWSYLHFKNSGRFLGTQFSEPTTTKQCAGTEVVKFWSDYVIVSFLALFVQFHRATYKRRADEIGRAHV